MVPGPPSYIFGNYVMCAFYSTNIRCATTEDEGREECSIGQRAVDNSGKGKGTPYGAVGAFAAISSPSPNPGYGYETAAGNLPGLLMKRYIDPITFRNQTINSETGYIGQLEAIPFQTRDPQIKARFEQVYINQTDIGFKSLSRTNLILDCTFPNEEQSDAGWDMVCIGNFDDSVLESGGPDGSNAQAFQQLFYVKGDDSVACAGVPAFPVAAV